MTTPASSSTPAARRKARRYALQALYQWQLAGTTLSDIEAQFLAQNDMSKVDRSYFHDLLHGVPARVSDLDESLRLYFTKPCSASIAMVMPPEPGSAARSPSSNRSR